MDLFVACDICGHRYVLPGGREGRKSKCKSCGVPFEISDDNAYDPETSELDDEDDDADGEDAPNSPLWGIMRKIGHGLAAMVTLSLLVWMGSLVIRSPQQVAAQSYPQGGAPRVNQNQRQTAPQQSFPQFKPNVPPSFDPRQKFRPGPGVNPGPQIKPAPGSVDGSIGWPSDAPGTRD